MPHAKSDECDNIDDNEMLTHRHIVNVTVNGQVVKALADTGSSHTLVNSSILNSAQTNFEECITIKCVHECEKDYPTANVIIEVQGQAFMLTAGVLDKLAYDVILGDDLPILDDLVQQDSVAYSCAVVTCSVTKGLEPLPNADKSF